MTRCTDPGYRIFAARGLRRQVKQLAEHLDGIRPGDDIEAIHRARVASRRLRAVLGLFRGCWKRKAVKAWKKQICRLTRNLSEARDHDVLIEFLAFSLAGVSDRALVPGIASLLNHVERQREWVQPRVLKATQRFEASGVLKTMQAGVRSILGDVGDGEPVVSACALGRAGKSVRKRLERLFDESAGLADPEQRQRHHAMRIAAKRLRYTLELVRPIYSGEPSGGDLAPAYEAVKKLQTLLGEIHDCDVWVENITEFAQKEASEIQVYFGASRRFERLRPGLEYLRQEREQRRGQVFEDLVAFWQELKDQGLWDRLAALLESRGSRAKSAEKADEPSPAEVSA